MQISGESVDIGDGSSLRFTKTLGRPNVTKFTLQILVGSDLVAGDIGSENIWGPNVTGSINYQTGALTLNFAAGHAPSHGAPIEVNYVQNGWGIGSGLLDEDGRPSHQVWVGKDFVYLKDVRKTIKVDLDDYLYTVAAHYFSVCKTEIQAWMPGTLFLGPDGMGTWGAPSPAKVLQAASKYVDFMVMGGGTVMSQPMLDFIYQNYGDKPLTIGTFQKANIDSALFRNGAGIGDFPTQKERGEHYFDIATRYVSAAYSANGSRPYIGVLWWQYLDNSTEKNNWGLVSLLDNAYDGHEAVQARVPCSPPLEKYTCGGEERNYGDAVSEVRRANQQILRSVQLP